MPFDLILSTSTKRSDRLQISPDRWNKQELTISLISKRIRTEEESPSDPHRDPLQISLVINDPQTLANLGAQLSTVSPRTPILTLFTPQNTPNSKPAAPTISLPAQYITRLWIKLFPPDDFAPEDWDSLALAWREAFACVPAQHHIENVLLDLHGIDPFEVPHVVPLLQEVSEEMYVKTKEESGRELVFGIVGAEGQRKWIEAQLPGKSEDELFEEELRAALQGRTGNA